MSDESDKSETDDLISTTYRSIASERVPDDLNERVLKMAAHPQDNKRRTSSLLSAWTRPAAWAATIGLCVVIVFQADQIQDQTQDSTAAESVSDQFVPRDSRSIEAAEDLARLQSGPNREQTYPVDSSSQAPSETALVCAAELRESEQPWFDCIRALRESNHPQDAEREYQMFVRMYPNFPPAE